MKTAIYFLACLFCLGLVYPASAQLKVKNSNGKVTIGSVNDAEEVLEVYGDGQVFGSSPYLRFKLNGNPAPGSEGGLHWRNSSGSENMRLYYNWNTNSLLIGPNDNENNAHVTIENFNGYVGIGTLNPSRELEVNGDIALSGQIVGISDRRTKMEIQRLHSTLEKIMRLNPVSYYYDKVKFKDLALPTTKQVGFIAQEVEKIFPEVVSDYTDYSEGDRDIHLMGIDYIKMIPILTKAIQEQQVLINKLLETQQIED